MPRADFVVTGAAGFLGQHLVKELAKRGTVVAWVRPGPPTHGVLDGYEVAAADVTRPQSLPEVPTGATVVHLAGVSDVGRCQRFPRLAARVHVEGTLNVLRAATEANARVVLASTAQVYGPLAGRIQEGARLKPTTVYGATKAAAEHLSQAYMDRVQTTIVRPFNVYGPGQAPYAVIPAIVRQLLDPNATAVRLNALAPRRDFVWVEDAAALLAAAATHSRQGTYNLATGRSCTIGEVARTAVEVSGRDLPIEAPAGTPEPDFQAATEAAEEAFGWRARTSLEAGLARLLQTEGQGAS